MAWSLHEIRTTVRNLWFRDTHEETIFINDTAVRIRAGILMIIPIMMGLTLFDVVFGSHWEITGNMIKDTFDTDFDGRILYHVEAVRRTYDYTLQTWVLFYALFEMLSGLFVSTSRLSPTILLASFLAKSHRPYWKPLVPKRFAWTLGSSFIIACLIFFNPDTFAGWVNALFHSEVLPTTSNYMPRWIPVTLVWTCLGFMWLETVLGFCMGCKLHSIAAKIGLVKEECEECNNLDFRY